MSEQGAGINVPEVAGGLLLQCVGGPLDGELVFLAGGNTVVDVGHFFDERRTPWIGVRIGEPNHLGSYVPRSFENGATADWVAAHLPEPPR